MNVAASAAAALKARAPDFDARAASDLFARLRGVSPLRIGVLRQDAITERAVLETRFPRAPIVSMDLARLGETPEDEPFDLIHSLSDLEWRPALRRQLPRLLQRLRPGGWLAALFPSDLYEPFRSAARMIAVDGPWSEALLPVAKTRPFNPTMEALYGFLRPGCAALDIWETVYLCAFDGVETIVEFARLTSLAPFLAPLGAAQRSAFLNRYREEMRLAYPPQPDGALLVRLPRIFLLAGR